MVRIISANQIVQILIVFLCNDLFLGLQLSEFCFNVILGYLEPVSALFIRTLLENLRANLPSLNCSVN